MTDLISRLETSGGSRELDAEIVRAIGREVERFMVADDHPVLIGGLEFMVEADGTRVGIPHYTTSIDAALTLVPEWMDGWGWELWRNPKSMKERPGWTIDVGAGEWKNWIQVTAPTPALALCIASLKALEQK